MEMTSHHLSVSQRQIAGFASFQGRVLNKPVNTKRQELLGIILEFVTNSREEILLFNSGQNQSSERLSNLPKATQDLAGEK